MSNIQQGISNDEVSRKTADYGLQPQQRPRTSNIEHPTPQSGASIELIAPWRDIEHRSDNGPRPAAPTCHGAAQRRRKPAANAEPSTLDPRPSCYVVIFPNTHLALKAERVAKEAGIPIKMIPVPRDISSDCNMGMRVSSEHKERLAAALKSKGVECRFVAR